MSDKKNNTKTPNTAPYLKQKNGANDPTKSNFVMPVILLLVSVAVIIGTFYENEFNSLMADIGIQTDDTTVIATASDVSEAIETIETKEIVANTVTPQDNTASTTEVVAVADESKVAASTAKIAVVESKVTASTAEVAVVDSKVTASTTEVAVVDSKVAASTTEENKVAEIVTTAKNTPNQTNNQSSHKQQAPVTAKVSVAPYQAVEHRRSKQEQYQAGVNRARAQAKQHYDAMQQRRQAYQQKMLERRQQYEAAMQAQRDRKAEIYETQKAVFELTKQDRVDTNEKIHALHKKISALHEEVHQVLRESQSSYNKTDTSTHHNSEIEKI